MASLNDTLFEAALKTLYPSEAIKNLVYKTAPFMALVAKDETFYGDSSKEPIQFGVAQNRSATFSNANTVNTTALLNAFLVTRVRNYSMAAIANETMEASDSDKGAFVSAIKVEIDGALRSLSNSIATQLYRSGTGSVARLSASATVNSSSTYVALANPADIVNIEPGMNLAFSSADGGTLRSYVTAAFVVNVNRTAGSFLCSGTAGSAAAALSSLVTSVAASDFVYQNAGDLNAVITGVTGWVPGVAAGSASFFGVNQTLDSRLAGLVYNGTSQSAEEAIISAAALLAREGSTPDHCFVNFDDWQRLVLAVSSKQQYIQYTDVKVMEPDVTIGFNSLLLTGPTGPIKIIPDRYCPVGTAMLLQLDTWKLKSVGPLVRIFNRDGLDMIRDPNSDGVLIRCFSYGNLSCRAPGWNAQVQLSTT